MKLFISVFFLSIMTISSGVSAQQVKKMIEDSWKVNVSGCNIYAVPRGKKIQMSVRCVDAQHPRVAIGYALALKNLNWCHVKGVVKMRNGFYEGEFDIVLEGCKG